MSDAAKTALVTGATGFIGGHLAARLIGDGWQVKLLVRDPGKLAPGLCGAEIITGSLADTEALAHAVRGVSVVFHCAANVHTWDKWEAYYAANVTGTGNLLAAIANQNPGLSRLVHISTMDVYGFPKTPCDEHCATDASGFGYGDSKWLGEQLVQQFCEMRNLPCTIIRPGNIIGPGSQFIERIGRELRSGLMLKIDKGRAHAGITYIDNLIDYLLWAAGAQKSIGQCYNVRDPYDVDWATFLTALRKSVHGHGLIINLPFAVADRAARLFEAWYRAFLPGREPLLHRLLVRIFGHTCGHNANKIITDSNMTSKIGFDEAMEKSVQWFLKER